MRVENRISRYERGKHFDAFAEYIRETYDARRTRFVEARGAAFRCRALVSKIIEIKPEKFPTGTLRDDAAGSRARPVNVLEIDRRLRQCWESSF